MDYIDISRNLNPAMAVWPGDPPFGIEQTLFLERGDAVNLTRLRLSAHTGTHVDAPIHFTPEGRTMDQVDLRPYWGTAQVVTVTKKEGFLTPADFATYDLSLAPRLLIRTPAARFEPTVFPEAYPHPGPELADLLGEQGIILYGTDAPSMDPVDSKELVGHHALQRHRILILEGLDLSQAADGLYELVALPLKVAGGDGSPVRAVLRTLS